MLIINKKYKTLHHRINIYLQNLYTKKKDSNNHITPSLEPLVDPPNFLKSYP